MVYINGEEKNIAGMTLMEYLKSADYDTKRIAIEKELEIIPKKDYETTVLADGDRLEIVVFVGGG